MRVLVKRPITKEFLTDSGTWTLDPAQARDFKTSTDAATFCTLHAIGDSELVLQLPQHEIGIMPYTRAYSHYDQPLND